MLKGNAIVGQSGGPTAVINASLAGVIETSIRSKTIDRILGMRFGIEGDKLEQVGEELADVICYALALANELNLDVSDILRNKMRKNERKYPAAEYRGRYGPEDDSSTTASG